MITIEEAKRTFDVFADHNSATYRRKCMYRQFFVCIACFILATSLVSLSPVSAQQAQPGGIVDVTAPVAALVTNNQLAVTASTALAGMDPARKMVKRLVVFFSTGTQRMATAVMEGQTLKITAPAGQTLTIMKALYGDVAFPLVDVTGRVRKAVAGDKVSLPVDVSLAGVEVDQPARDPAPGKTKQIRVSYSVGGTPHTATVADGDTLNLPSPEDGTGALAIDSAVYGDLNAQIDVNALLTTKYAMSTAATPAKPMLPRPPLLVTPVQPVRFEKRGETYFADFGKDAYGNLQITFPGAVPVATLTVRLGEKLGADGTIDRKPGGSINYREIPLTTQAGQSVYQLQIPTKERHRNKAAVHTPPEIGEVTPFRYAEIEGSPAALEQSALRQMFVHIAFDDNASSFTSSDETLNAVWELCKYTMKATTAFGVYIDGERERIPYEADAYINQLSHWAADLSPEITRHTVEHLLAHPTWPTEWSFHMPMMAAADYEATGNAILAERNYEELKKKLLMNKAREDGLLRAGAIVDWPQAERDGYNEGKVASDHGQMVGPMINTVANAFYYHALQKMAMLARVLKKDDEARDFDAKAAQVYQMFNAKLFDAARGVYIDGEGSTHASLHANMFPLAFDLVPAERQQAVADFVQSRGMACSVYGAQYLLEALYKAGKDDYALQLMTDKSDRGWWHMIELGSTMTLEAWDQKYKGNLTWNHAWGSAPANIISRYLLGVRPLTPGYEKILIAPRPGTLKSAQAKVPTARGPVTVNFQNEARFRLEVEVPQGASARVSLPVKDGAAAKSAWVLMDKKKVAATPEGSALIVDNVGPGRHVFEVR
jgi:alpha-L-rhamnosidase